MAIFSTIADSIQQTTELDDTTALLDSTTIVGPLAPAFSEALNEVFAKMPSTVDGGSGTDLVTESQQISSVQQRKLIASIPHEFGKGASSAGLNTIIYAVTRNGITSNDVTNIGDRMRNITRSLWADASPNRPPLIVVMDVNVDGTVNRYTNEVNEGLALAVESYGRVFGVPVVNSLPAALKALSGK